MLTLGHIRFLPKLRCTVDSGSPDEYVSPPIPASAQRWRAFLLALALLHGIGADEAFRPDQVKILSEVVREIGFDVAALETDQYKLDIDQKKRLGLEQQKEIQALRDHADKLQSILEAAARHGAVR